MQFADMLEARVARFDQAPRRRREVLDLRQPQGLDTRPQSPLTPVVERYLMHKEAHDVGPNTLDTYRYALEQVLIPWCERHGVSSWEQLDQHLIDGLRVQLFKRGNPFRRDPRPLSPATANSYCRHVNYFLSWLHQEAEDSGLPQRKRKLKATTLKKEPSRADALVSPQDALRMEQACSDLRDRLLIRLLADTGVRPSELVTLRYDRIGRVLGEDQMRVLKKAGKGFEERTVPLPLRGVIQKVEQYLRQTGGRSPAQPYVFVGKLRNSEGQLERMTTNALQKMIRNLKRKLAISGPLHPYMFRHTFITRCLLQGDIPETVIARAVGHSNLRMLERYAHVKDQDVVRLLREKLGPELRRIV